LELHQTPTLKEAKLVPPASEFAQDQLRAAVIYAQNFHPALNLSLRPAIRLAMAMRRTTLSACSGGSAYGMVVGAPRSQLLGDEQSKFFVQKARSILTDLRRSCDGAKKAEACLRCDSSNCACG
jgi:hypothetical protein